VHLTNVVVIYLLEFRLLLSVCYPPVQEMAPTGNVDMCTSFKHQAKHFKYTVNNLDLWRKSTIRVHAELDF